MDRPATLASAGITRPDKDKTILPTLAVVVIARNEEENIGASLEAALAAVCGQDCSEVVLVDSDSSDRTVEIAQQYPISILRYRAERPTAAAGRRIGFAHVRASYVQFIDGDCCIEPGFIEAALQELASHPDVAAVYGARRNITPGQNLESAPMVHASLGGNALYRASALTQVDSFNPYIIGEEEGELLGRLQAAGFRAVSIRRLMITHYTEALQTVEGFLQRHRRGLGRGSGQVLRLSIKQGLFWYHARRLNRYLMTLMFILLGLILVVASLLARTPAPIFLWLSAALVVFVLLWVKRRSLRSAAFIVADWVTVALSMIKGLVRTSKLPITFAPIVERLK